MSAGIDTKDTGKQSQMKRKGGEKNDDLRE